MTEKKQGNGYSAPILYKTFTILEEISKNQSELGISDLARRSNISKSTVHGIIQALTDLGVIRQDSNKKFMLGPTLVQLGNRALAGGDLRLLVRPYMEELGKEFKETIFLGTYDQQRITIIEKVDSPSELKISAPVGTRISLFAGATGKVFLSGLTEQELQAILAEKAIPEFTVNSITDPILYLKEIEKVREQGYATDFEEYIQGVNAVCVPVSDGSQRVVAAIWMVGFANTFNGDRVTRAITEMMRSAQNINEIIKT